MYMVHGMESSGQFFQGIKNIMKNTLSESVHTHSTATPIPIKLISTGTEDFPLLSDGSKLQNQANLCHIHFPYSLARVCRMFRVATIT
jgi:hypothetical protein